MNNYYSVNDLAEQLGVTTRSIRNYIQSGKLKGTKIGGQWRFSEDDVLNFISGNEFVPIIRNKSLPFEDGPVIMRFNLYFENFPSLEKLKNTIIDYHLDVYANDKNRLFYYQIYKENHVELLIKGSFNYVVSFGTWINQLLKDQTDIYEVDDNKS